MSTDSDTKQSKPSGTAARLELLEEEIRKLAEQRLETMETYIKKLSDRVADKGAVEYIDQDLSALREHLVQLKNAVELQSNCTLNTEGVERRLGQVARHVRELGGLRNQFFELKGSLDAHMSRPIDTRDLSERFERLLQKVEAEIDDKFEGVAQRIESID